jgi:methionine aminopeptidase, type I
MAISIKSEREIELMRHAGEVLAKTHLELAEHIKPGTTTWHINKIADEIIRSYSCIPSFLNYSGYPASVCISVNEEVVHGIPSKKNIIKDTDIVSIDAGVIWKGYHSDAARTYAMPAASKEALELIKVTEESFFEGIKYAKSGNFLNDICSAIDEYLSSRGYGIVRDLVGHGVGSSLHESPEVPNFKMDHKGVRLRAGMTLAIEPMVNIGRGDVDFLDDGWTVKTSDRTLSAHYENTVLITDEGPDILSLLK